MISPSPHFQYCSAFLCCLLIAIPFSFFIFPSSAFADIQPGTFYNASDIYIVTNADPAVQVYEVFDSFGTNVLELSNK